MQGPGILKDATSLMPAPPSESSLLSWLSESSSGFSEGFSCVLCWGLGPKAHVSWVYFLMHSTHNYQVPFKCLAMSEGSDFSSIFCLISVASPSAVSASRLYPPSSPFLLGHCFNIHSFSCLNNFINYHSSYRKYLSPVFPSLTSLIFNIKCFKISPNLDN